jgi:preprotein translocase subunit YajC
MTDGWTMSEWTMMAQAPPVAGDPAPAPAGEAAPGGQQPGGQAPPPTPFGGGFLFLLLGLFVFMLLLSSMGQRKEKKRRAEMLSSLGKHDRIQTMGGVIGTITELRGDEVVVKVDETTNTKIRFARSAVQAVLKKSGAPGEGETAAEPELASP